MSQASVGYPQRLLERLKGDAPKLLRARGDLALLEQPQLAIFCSVQPPADLVLPALDFGRVLRSQGRWIIGGFQSPVERLILEGGVHAGAGVTVSPAREIDRLRVEPSWDAAIREGRMLLLSCFERRRRTDAAMAVQRNRLVAALSEEIFVVHAAEGGRIHRLVEEALQWGIAVHCMAHEANSPLELLGAVPVENVRYSRGRAGPRGSGRLDLPHDGPARRAIRALR